MALPKCRIESDEVARLVEAANARKPAPLADAGRSSVEKDSGCQEPFSSKNRCWPGAEGRAGRPGRRQVLCKPNA